MDALCQPGRMEARQGWVVRIKNKVMGVSRKAGEWVVIGNRIQVVQLPKNYSWNSWSKSAIFARVATVWQEPKP